MEGNVWELAGAAGKWLSLIAVAGVVGGGFSLGLAHRLDFARQAALSNYLLASALVGLLATSCFFLAQVGAINQSGLAGILDMQMALILAQSSPGHTAAFRLLGFTFAISSWLLLRKAKRTTGRTAYWTAGFLMFLAGTILLGLSFAASGHTSTLPLLPRSATVLHVLAVSLWIGSLYPLLRLSTTADLCKVQRLMQWFGTSALFIVAVLLLSGIFLLTQLLQSFAELLTTAYGLTVLLKLIAVAGLLALAGMNKLLLVPRLTTNNSARLLQGSIRTEIAMALFILIVTTWLTMAVGPA